MTETYPTTEANRLKALKKYDILDTPQDGNFDRLTALAASIFNVPISIISLVDTDRIWFKSHHGLDAQQIDRDPGLCASAILADDVYLVENAIEDIRTLANPLVAGEFGLRFYAAAPLQTSDGLNIGTFCIIDQKQRYFNDQQKSILKEMAAITMDEMEIRLAARLHTKKINELLGETAKTLQQTVQTITNLPENTQTDRLQEQVLASQQVLKKIEKHFTTQL